MSNRKYSKKLVDGPLQAASRSMLRGVGFETSDFSKSLVGIASTWSKVTPCNMHINELADLVESSIDSSGCKGVLFNTITVSDGISMGTQGMKFSLVSRGDDMFLAFEKTDDQQNTKIILKMSILLSKHYLN